ncbi:MAG: hypothetical protein ABSB91_09690 [Sedimentisphaerales bacterium]
MIFIGFTIVASVACLCLYGWGLLCLRLSKYPVRNWVMTIIIGLGVVIFLGGVLNLLRLAYGWAFDILFIIGIALAGWFTRFKFKLPRKVSDWLCAAIPGLLIVVIMLFTVKTQLPPKVFNWHDDFEKYFAHPVRMLETGTLFGSPLNALGSETLGGQAVLHGIVLNHFPIQYINGVDTVFGLLLCLLLSVSMFGLRAAYLPMFVLSPLVVFFINPQYVNVSALYMGSAFIMTSILLFSCPDDFENNEKAGKLPSPVLTGIVFAALIALKSNFIVFPPLLLILFVTARAVFGRGLGRLIRWMLLTAGMTLLFILPWLLLYLPYYIHSSFAQVPHTADIVIPADRPLNLFSAQPLYYNSSPLHYTFLCMAIAAIITGVVLWKFKKHANIPAGLAAGGAAIIIAYLLLALLSPFISGFEISIRYSIPFLIAGPAVIFSLVYLRAVENKHIGFRIAFAVITPLLGIPIIISFYSSCMARVRQASETGSILAFSSTAASKNFIEYNKEVLYGDTKQRVISAQQQVPAGQPVVALIGAPFYLDYKRNTIYDAERSGIATPWAIIPDVNYFLLRYKGPAVHSIGEYLHPFPGKRELYISEKCIAFLRFFEQLLHSADVIYDDGTMLVIRKRGPVPGQNP